MVPLLLLGIAAAGSLAAYLLSEDEVKYSDMANVHNYFLDFEKNISVPSSKKKKLIASRKSVENVIIDFFKTKGDLIPKFYIQGSYKMKTMIMDKEGSYDVDLGVYFLVKPKIEPLTLQKWILEAVSKHTISGAEHREKCIRVKYKGDFDIDLPVYYKVQNEKHPFLATKTKWVESDPKELCDWFDAKKDANGQLLRLIKYFKAWANNRTKKMPSGIAFTVWATNNYKPNDRDDIAFYETAKSIKKEFGLELVSKNPATPGDDFLSRLDSKQKDNFKESFKTLLEDAEQALKQESTDKACNIWRNQFGERFPNSK